MDLVHHCACLAVGASRHPLFSCGQPAPRQLQRRCHVGFRSELLTNDLPALT